MQTWRETRRYTVTINMAALLRLDSSQKPDQESPAPPRTVANQQSQR